jgi:hypothetical protein
MHVTSEAERTLGQGMRSAVCTMQGIAFTRMGFHSVFVPLL